MFPRISSLYRLLAALFLTGFIMLIVNNTNDLIRLSQTDMKRAIQDMTNPYSMETYIENVTALATSKRVVTLGKPVNPHNFAYIVNPSDLCRDRHLTYIVYVHTAPMNFKKRQMIRQTWSSKNMMLRYKMRTIFCMGVVDDTVTMQRVMIESSRYGDIMVKDFQDTYRNLTHKAVSALKWVSEHCANVTYVIKSDDDILIDMDALIGILRSPTVQEYGHEKVILCNLWSNMKVIRDKRSKGYISEDEFAEEFFPPYCSGSIYIMTSDVVRDMYAVSRYTKFFWVDDFYVTGALVQKIGGVQHKKLNDKYDLSAKTALTHLTADKEQKKKFFHVHKLTDIYKMWKIITKRNKMSNCAECTLKKTEPAGT